jgi:hypothetical protein
MKKSIIILLVFFVLLGIENTLAQEGPFPSSGIGILAPEKGINSMYYNFPLAEIILYNTPDGANAGIIIKKNSLNIIYKLNDQPLAFRVNEKDIAEIEFAGFCLKYFEQQGNFVKVLVNSTIKGYWISLAELQYLRYKSISWMDVFSFKKKFFYSQVDVGVNLRSEPDQKSRKIMLLKGNHYAIMLTGEIDGLWAEVIVGHYSKPPCEQNDQGGKPTEEWNGWIKVIDDAGYPNIWFYPRGCK